jgi:UDP-N-acetylglucosamine 2-epimerase (non-hydrolysing)
MPPEVEDPSKPPTSDLPPGSVAVVLGTRPEIVKLAHVIRFLGPAARIVHTGQHYDDKLSEVFLKVFDLPEPDAHIGVGGQTRGAQIGSAVSALDSYLEQRPPLAIVVQGDTNASLAGAIAANAREIPLAHVEAGLRSFDRRMPEEHNRVLTDHLSDLLFAPTTVAEKNLASEGIPADRIAVTGNTVVEAVLELMPDTAERSDLLRTHRVEANRFVLSTFHRPENVDDPARFEAILDQLVALPLPVLLPLHPRSVSRASEYGLTGKLESLQVVEPIGYREFLGLGAESAFLVSDSGGVQEEVSVFKRSVIVVRRTTERPEVLGTFAELVEPGLGIATVADRWMEDLEGLHRRLADLPSPYGDGSASAQIVRETEKLVGAS